MASLQKTPFGAFIFKATKSILCFDSMEATIKLRSRMSVKECLFKIRVNIVLGKLSHPGLLKRLFSSVSCVKERLLKCCVKRVYFNHSVMLYGIYAKKKFTYSM